MSFFSLIQEIWCADWLKVTQHLQWTCSPCSFECTSLFVSEFWICICTANRTCQVFLTCQEYEKSNLLILYSKLGCRDCCDGMTSVAGKEPAGWIGWIGSRSPTSCTNQRSQAHHPDFLAFWRGCLWSPFWFLRWFIILVTELWLQKKTSWSRKRLLYLKKKENLGSSKMWGVELLRLLF